MSKSYLLPCGCGETITVEKTQAGQTVSCSSCGENSEVPTLRGFRELKEVADESPEGGTKREANWSISQGYLFSVGLVLLAIGLSVATVVYGWRMDMGRFSNKPIITDRKEFDEDVDDWNAEELWDQWQEKIESSDKNQGLGFWQPPNYLFARNVIDAWTVIIVTALVVAMVGLISTVAAFVFKPKTAAPSLKQKPG